jgi:mycothiol synthase
MAEMFAARLASEENGYGLESRDDLRLRMQDSQAPRRLGLVGLPHGYASRPLAADDISAVYYLETAGEVFDDGVAEVELADLEADWRRPDFDLATMSVGVFQGLDLVAYATVFKDRAEALVRPDQRGRGIGTVLLRWTWEAARADGRDRIGQTISQNERTAEALFQAHGYEYGHTSWVLGVELDADIAPPRPELPRGYGFRVYRAGVDDREIFALIDAAFEEWRGLTSESWGFHNWAASILDNATSELVVLIACRNRMVGAAVGGDCGADAEGWIQQMAVARDHRGRGLGRALLEESFRRFWHFGRLRCSVSTDSRTGALGLYEHVGMTVRRSYTRWIKQGL